MVKSTHTPHPPTRRRRRLRHCAAGHAAISSARGEPFVWIMGAALVAGLAMITGFLAFVLYVGAMTFWPAAIEAVTTTDGKLIAGEAFRSEIYRVPEEQLQIRPADVRATIAANLGMAERTLYRVGNYDLFGEDFVWVSDFDKISVTFHKDIYLIERLEWGPFIGRVRGLDLAAAKTANPSFATLAKAHRAAVARRATDRSSRKSRHRGGQSPNRRSAACVQTRGARLRRRQR